jgi:hypothetical protein
MLSPRPRTDYTRNVVFSALYREIYSLKILIFIILICTLIKVTEQFNPMYFESPLPGLLRAAIWTRYRKIPSNAFLARQFNLQASGRKTVSQESFRRWMLGESMPEYEHLRTLIGWLHLDANQIFSAPSKKPQPDAGLAEAEWLNSTIGRWEQTLRRISVPKGQALADLIDRLLLFEPARNEKTYTNFSDLLASTRAATAGLVAHENTPRS